MEEIYSGAARQQHLYQAVAKFQRGLAQDLRDLREDFASRGVSGMGWHPRIKEAMERLRTVGDEMLAFDADYAELLAEQLKVAGTTPTVNPFGEDRAALIVDYASGAAGGLATSISRDGKLDSAHGEHVLTVAKEVAAAEAYRLRREYVRRRELFAVQTSGHRPVDAPLPAGDGSERGQTPLERSAVDRLIALFERYRCEYPHLRYARIPLRDGNLPPELSCNGRDGSAVGSVVDAIGQSVRDAATAIFNNQLDVDGQPTMHLVLNDSDSLDGWQRFTALAEKALRFPWQATVDGVVLPKRTHVHPGLDWLSIVCAVAAGDKTHTQLLRQTWLQWRDRHEVLRSCCLPSDTGAIESNLAGLGLSGDVEYQIDYEELQNIFDVSAEVLGIFVNDAPLIAPDSTKSDTPETAHAPDFRSVRWFGKRYEFTANQAAAVRVLWQAWKNGTPDVGDETILAAIDHEAPPERLNVQFRGHAAWNTMIVAGATKGTHRLREPSV